jgi:beta-galactosidase
MNYWPTTRVDLTFDGQGPVELPIRPVGEPQTFAIEPPRRAKQIRLQVASWDQVPGKSANVGIDDIKIKVRRSADFLALVKPMLNVGGLMHYPQGNGGIVFCNLAFKDDEAVPINATKKRTILRTILANLTAPFSGGKTVIVGAGLTYQPIDLRRQANQFRTERGWFGDSRFTFGALPTGRQEFSGVTYNIDDFATSPVPTVVMLGGPGIPNQPGLEARGIPVDRKADALFLLQAAKIDRRRDPKEIRENQSIEIARYVVHYADGKQETIPIRAEVDVDDYRQKSPTALPGAQVAWTRPYEGTGLSAVAYSMQWNNPRPEVEIREIDLLPGPDRPRGTLALLAISAAVSAAPGR